MRTPLEVQEIQTYHNLLNRSYHLPLHDSNTTRQISWEIRAACEVEIITLEMGELIFSVMCRKEREAQYPNKKDWNYLYF